MALSATRFKILDQETNVATTDFTSLKSADVLNSPSISGINITASLTSMVSGALGDKLKSAISNATGKLGAAGKLNSLASLAKSASKFASGGIGRIAKDGLSSIISVAGNTPASLAKSVDAALGASSGLSKITKNLAPGDVSSMLSGSLSVPTSLTQVTSGKFTSMIPGGLDKATGISSLVDKASGGAFGAVLSNVGNAQSIITSVGGAAIKSGMAGAFTALKTGHLDKNMLKNAGASLLKTAGESKNLLAIAEIANDALSIGINAIMPGVPKTITSGVKVPAGTSEPDYIKQYGVVKDSLDFTDPSWCKADSDVKSSEPAYSIANIDSTNTDFGKMLEVKSKSYTPVISTDGVVAPVEQDAIVHTAVATETQAFTTMKQMTPMEELQAMYPTCTVSYDESFKDMGT